MSGCLLCPRACGSDRVSGRRGVCGAGDTIRVARAALHMWEEPPISADRGSGAIFFAHCPLRCVYCQNMEISRDGKGEDISEERLVQLMLGLERQGAVNVNLVSASHYARHAASAVRQARACGLSIPVVWNTSGYETTETLCGISDAVDVYLPDFKYWDSAAAKRYSAAEEYPIVAKRAIDCMFALQPKTVFDDLGIMKRGVLVRHLVLPGRTKDAKLILKYLCDVYGPDTYVSLMCQYTPPENLRGFPEIQRKVRPAEYDSVVDFAARLGLRNVFVQEPGAADRCFIPEFYSELADGAEAGFPEA